MKFVIASGGSGGHFFPALYVAKELKKEGHQVYFVGAFGGIEERIKKTGFPYWNLTAKGFNKKSLKSVLQFPFHMIQSILASLRILKDIKPDAVCGFGGYASFPVVFSAVLLKYPTMVHEQNVVPGKANRVLYPLVKKMAVSFELTRRDFFKNVRGRTKTVLTGCPCHLRDRHMTPEAARKDLGLDPAKKTIAVLGGSQGSHAINGTFIETVPLLKSLDIQVIHLSGKSDFSQLEERYRAQNIPHRVFAFCDEMDKVYAAADIVISRAGAATVSELAHFAIPSVLIPYPFAGGHQSFNAVVLVEAGAARMIEEQDLTPGILARHILDILKDPPTRPAMEERLKDVSFSNAAVRIAQEAVALVK